MRRENKCYKAGHAQFVEGALPAKTQREDLPSERSSSIFFSPLVKPAEAVVFATNNLLASDPSSILKLNGKALTASRSELRMSHGRLYIQSPLSPISNENTFGSHYASDSSLKSLSVTLFSWSLIC